MTVLRVRTNNKKIETVEALARPKYIDGKKYFEIRCGNYIPGAWCVPVTVSDTLVNKDEAVYKFDGNNYKLIPIKIGKRFKTDSRGNRLYFIGIDYEATTSEEQIIIWDLPSNIDDLSYRVNGKISIVSECETGRTVNGLLITSPSLLLHVYGPALLSYTGTDEIGEKVAVNYQIEGKH
jgi:hypothetical protein